MNFLEIPYRIKRRVTNEIRGYLLKNQLIGASRINARFLFTCLHGVMMYDNGKIRKLTSGRIFGITAQNKETILVAEWIDNKMHPTERCEIFRYHFDGKSLTGKTKITFKDQSENELQPFGVHQIRVLNGFLWVTNTRENVVWKCTLDGHVLVEWTENRKMPFNELDYKNSIRYLKETEDYKHYNSINYHEGHYYILAHNCTLRNVDINKKSYILKLTEDLQIVEKIENTGRASHDILFIDNKLYVCSSRNGQILEDNVPIIDLNGFLRGLIRIGSMLVIGGSQFEIQRSARESSTSKLFFVDYPARRSLLTIELGRVGNIRDLYSLEQS